MSPETSITFSGQTRAVWLEWNQTDQTGNPSVISLARRQTGSGSIWTVVDSVTYLRTNVLVIGLGGHMQSAPGAAGRRGAVHQNSGVQRIANALYAMDASDGEVWLPGVLTFAEDPGNDDPIDASIHPWACGDGVHGRPTHWRRRYRFYWGAYNRSINLIQTWGVRRLAFYGYSHGASSVRMLSHRIEVARQSPAGLPPITIFFTGYIDGVRLPPGNEVFDGSEDPPPGSRHPFDFIAYDEEEYRFPYLTRYHVNAFQRTINEPDSGVFDLRGGPLDGLWVGSTQIEDGAGRAADFTPYEGNRPYIDINVNLAVTFVRDPLVFGDPQQVNNFDPTLYAQLAHLDHNNDGIGSGPREAPPGVNESIDAHPVVHRFIIEHMDRAFRRT